LIVVPASGARTRAHPQFKKESAMSTMEARKSAFKPGRAQEWTRERVEQLSKQDIEQLRVNAERLGEAGVVAVCDEALNARPRNAGGRASAAPRANTKHLVSRTKAFQARGVYLPDVANSWSGVRKADGVVVMSLWAGGIVSGNDGCSCLLWGPNVEGSRPWSDTGPGKVRLEHCRLALKQGGAEGLLVHGEQLAGHLPEHKARSVHGVDPEVVVRFKVEQRGEEFWAVWGAKADPASL
jgi:hypothetical protein